MTPHLLVAISSHGYGHLAQVSPVINALQDMSDQGQAPAFELTIRSSLPPAQIARRVRRRFTVDTGSDDFGMVMHDALRVDLVRSLCRYALLHQQWDRAVDRLTEHLRSLGVTGVLADAPYLTLASAQGAGMASIGICSLNWADILERCVARQPHAQQAAGVSPGTLAQILHQMRQAYASAHTILSPAPALQTTHLQTRSIDPIANTPAAPEPDRLWQMVRAHSVTPAHQTITTGRQCWLVLASMGGIGLHLDPRLWPSECLGRPVLYLMAKDTTPACPHVVALDFEEMGFGKLMASCDLVLTKPGYGMFVEARACCKPMLYLARDDWPESQCLEQWARLHAHAVKLTADQLAHGRFSAELERLLSMPALEPMVFNGARQAASCIVDHLLL